MTRETRSFDWSALRLVDQRGESVPPPSDGPFLLVYWSPWCGDCVAQWDELRAEAAARGGRAAFVSCFAPVTEVDAFLARHPMSVPCWREPSEKIEADRVGTFHAALRELAGDTRRWGVPALRELQIQAGRFVVRSM